MRAWVGAALCSLAACGAGCTAAPPSAPTNVTPPAPIANQERAKWRPVGQHTGLIDDVDGLQALAHAYPASASVRLRLLQAYVKVEDHDAAVEQAKWLVERGYAFSPNAQSQILEWAGQDGAGERAEFAKRLAGNAAPIEASTLVDTIPAAALLVECLAIFQGQTFATTIISKDLFSGSANGWTGLDIDRAGSLAGLAIDEPRGLLWAASGVYDVTPGGENAFRGLIGVAIKEGVDERRITAPADAAPSDIHLANDGTIYASDPISGNIYSAGPSESALSLLVNEGTFRSPQGIASSENGRLLYISDYRYGLAVISLETGQVSPLIPAEPMALNGIDSLLRIGDRLIAIQNGMSPMRIISVSLSSDGYSATKLTVLEQAHSQWTEPLGGTIHGEELFYVATGQWDRFGEGGSVSETRKPRATDIRRLPLE